MAAEYLQLSEAGMASMRDRGPGLRRSWVNAQHPLPTPLHGSEREGGAQAAGLAFAGRRAPLWPQAGIAKTQVGPFPRRACLARSHTGHRLGAHTHVHAPPQHRDQAATVHQVSGRGGQG